MQSSHAKHSKEGNYKTNQIRCKDQGAAASSGHDNQVMQSIADGYTAIIGHGRQKETFSGTKKIKKKIHLDEAIQV